MNPATLDTPARRLADATGIDDAAVAAAPSIKSVYVYEAPVRLWHWVNALAITVLAVTGYFIGKPLPKMPGVRCSRLRANRVARCALPVAWSSGCSRSTAGCATT